MTIDDVARRAGVSRTSVSRALLGQNKVSDQTRSRVRQAAEELGYVPSVAASTLASGRGDTLGLLLRDAANPAYGLLFTELQRYGREAGRQVVSMTVTTDEHGRGQVAALHHLVGLRVAGLVVATGGLSTEQLLPFAGILPIVRAGRPEESGLLHAVSYDERGGGAEVARAIHAHGHRRVAVLVTDADVSYPEWVRGTAIVETLRALGVDVDELAVRRHFEGATEVCDLARQRRVSAVACPSDMRALQVLRVARSQGLRVPDDLSVTGFDGILPGADLIGLATYRIPVEEVASAAIRTLLEVVNGAEGVHQLQMSGRFVEAPSLDRPVPAPT
ncbi:LacI family DNA-binding transcriptional regulator [Luteococcus peritonei]|uniref:LacI family DNA-binding transcriptional regulator n=1 Tax=Luteococcus peritonei TaxID=88874 RepID=A0ABW4RWF8_9ACTN